MYKELKYVAIEVKKPQHLVKDTYYKDGLHTIEIDGIEVKRELLEQKDNKFNYIKIFNFDNGNYVREGHTI